MRDFRGKVAFVTGGGSGVALGQAKVFAAEGMKVVIADIRQDHLDEAMTHFREQKQPVHPIRLDITDREAYARAADEAERVFGPVQLLCNTAGVSQFGPMQNATYDDWDWQMSVNVGGVINNDLYVIPYAEFREPLIELHERVLAALPDPKDDPGMRFRMAAMQARRAERDSEAKG